MLEALGKAHNEPSAQQLMEASALNDAKHPALTGNILCPTPAPAHTLHKLSHVVMLLPMAGSR